MIAKDYRTGMVVECLDSRLGTIAGLAGVPGAQVLEVRPDKQRDASAVLRIPERYVAQVLESTVLLNVDCAEASRIGRVAREDTAVTTSSTVPAVAPAAMAQPAVSAGGAPTEILNTGTEHIMIPVIEETIVPVKSWQEAGALELRKTISTVVENLDVPLQYEEATVERVAVGRALAEGENVAPHQEGDTLIVPVVHEELVVMRRRVLVEELHITKQMRTRTEHISESVRREEVQISHQGLEALDNGPGQPAR